MDADYRFQMEWHAVMRADERFNHALTREDLSKITAECREGKLQLLEEHIEDLHGRTRRLYKTTLGQEDCIVVYDPKWDVVVTFLGNDSAQWMRLVGFNRPRRAV